MPPARTYGSRDNRPLTSTLQQNGEVYDQESLPTFSALTVADSDNGRPQLRHCATNCRVRECNMRHVTAHLDLLHRCLHDRRLWHLQLVLERSAGMRHAVQNVPP